MAILKPFKGIRPTAEMVKRVACRPYDVLDEKKPASKRMATPTLSTM